MVCYILAMGKQHLGLHVVVGYSIKIFWQGLFIMSPDHLEDVDVAINYAGYQSKKQQENNYFSGFLHFLLGQSHWVFVPGYLSRGGGTPLYGLYRYVRLQRVWFFSRFGHK